MTTLRLALCLGLVSTSALAQPAPADALEVYEEGKRRYDAKDYAGALERFDEAARLEPKTARWQYNRGLALKKLQRTDEAIAALQQSRALDPAYKKAEIDEKLAELGVSGPGSASSPGGSDDSGFVNLLIGGGICIFAFFGVGVPVFKILKAVLSPRPSTAPTTAARAPTAATKNDPNRVQAVAGKLTEAGWALGQVEHALSLGEDAEARGHADRAATNLATVRRGLAAARRNERPLAELESALTRASEATALAKARVTTLHGPRAMQVKGPRAGCFFCARALPTPRAGVPVTLESGSTTTTVAACAICARRVGTAQPPPVTMVERDGQRAHWAEHDDFDPYVQAHAPPPDAVEVPAWQVLQRERGLSPLAGLAGGAVLGALGAAAVGKLLDLDGLKQSSLASEAAQAAARAASSRRSTEYTDHS
ncbi:MAG: tetratricopeptide repeat protein [Myxococcaceae bacterium]|nr:tetratricopeptide repeat protein [Myxococcaceae bacterium]